VRKKLFIVGRVGFGLLYLGAALFNWVMAIASPETFRSFTNDAYIDFYRDAWVKVVDPHLTLWIVVLGFVEFGLGILFFSKRGYVRVGLALGIIFTLVLAPSNHETLLNLVLVALQMLMLSYDLNSRQNRMRIARKT